MSDDIEKVELDESAADAIAEKAAGLVSASTDEAMTALKAEIAELKTLLKPQRTDLGDGAEKAAKPSEGVFYGGDDVYTFTGETDAERATNLFIASVMLEQAENKAERKLSRRAQDVMVKAAEAALKTAPAPILPPTRDGRDPEAKLAGHLAGIKSNYGQLRAEAYKAMTSTSANNGDEWVPTFASSELWRDIHLATQVAALVNTVTMPTNPYDLPTETADVTYRLAATENTAVTASNPTTDKAQLSAKKIMAEVDFSGEITEDSIIPIVSAIRTNLVRRGAQTIDDLIVHGDTETGGTGNINSDDTAPASSAFYLAFNGLRKFATVTNTGQRSTISAALSSSNFNTVRALLGKYGARPSDLAIVSGTSQYLAALTISEVLTAEKYGPNATVLTGELARFFGIPWFLSEAIPGASTDKVDADGKYTTTSPSSNDTKGWFVLFNRNLWTKGFRREFNIESFRDITADKNILVASFRMALTSGGHSTTHTAVGINTTV